MSNNLKDLATRVNPGFVLFLRKAQQAYNLYWLDIT